LESLLAAVSVKVMTEGIICTSSTQALILSVYLTITGCTVALALC